MWEIRGNKDGLESIYLVSTLLRLLSPLEDGLNRAKCSGFSVPWLPTEFRPLSILRARRGMRFLSFHIERSPLVGCIQQCACKYVTTGSLKRSRRRVLVCSISWVLWYSISITTNMAANVTSLNADLDKDANNQRLHVLAHGWPCLPTE